MTTAPPVQRLSKVHRLEYASPQWRWLLAGLAVAFGVPFVLADLLSVPRDALRRSSPSGRVPLDSTFAQRSDAAGA
jgi:hypothetical protein